MIRTFCDRCGTETTKQDAARITGRQIVDTRGNGAVSEDLDVCDQCYRSWLLWTQKTDR